MKNLGLFSLSILTVLGNEMEYWGKTRVFPSHKRIRNEMKEKCSVTKSERTVNRWLAMMEAAGLIRRNKRHRWTPANGWEFRSSLYEITMLGWNLLFRQGVWTRNKYNSLVQKAKSTFRKSKKPRKVSRPSGELTHVSESFKCLLHNTS